MRRASLFGMSLLAVTVSASTAEDQAYFAIFAETKLMRIAGMPAMDIPELPAGVSLPGGISIPGKPSRSLNVRLWSPSIAPSNATATVAPPAGLKVGGQLKLELYRPTAEEQSGKGGGGGFNDNPEFTVKMYWGSSATVQPGQPKIIKWGTLTPEQRTEMNKRTREAQPGAQGSYFYKPDWTTGYWPTKSQAGAIAKDASLAGTYSLTTNYTGNVAVDVPAGMDFLAPIELSSPNLDNELDFTKTLLFQWKPIANTLGQSAFAMGAEGKNTLILWTSSEVFTEAAMGDMGYLQMAEVRQRVADKLFMPADQTKFNIPAGIFKDADFAMLNMVAYGPGAAADKAQPLPRVQTKSTLQVMLGGKEMKGAR
ncbi:MAG: hypothetical protein ACAH95_00055 [Fimbriimonas sp.]